MTLHSPEKETVRSFTVEAMGTGQVVGAAFCAPRGRDLPGDSIEYDDEQEYEYDLLERRTPNAPRAGQARNPDSYTILARAPHCAVTKE